MVASRTEKAYFLLAKESGSQPASAVTLYMPDIAPDKECALGHSAEGFYQRDALVQQSDLRVQGNHLHMDDPWGHVFW